MPYKDRQTKLIYNRVYSMRLCGPVNFDYETVYDDFMIKQKGLCALCHKKRRLVLDHDHTTGSARGLLCHACNTAIGKLGDSIEGLEKAIQYLKKGL